MHTLSEAGPVTSDYYFGDESGFICLFKSSGKYICKAYLDLSDAEFDTMMRKSGDWCHFVVNRDDAGNAIVVHTDCSTVTNLGGFALEASMAMLLDDAQIVALSQKGIIQSNNLSQFLKEEFAVHKHSSWSRRQLVGLFGAQAVEALTAHGHLVYSSDGWVALAHVIKGTVQNQLIEINLNSNIVDEMQAYFTDFKLPGN